MMAKTPRFIISTFITIPPMENLAQPLEEEVLTDVLQGNTIPLFSSTRKL